MGALVANISAMRDDRFLASFIGAEAPTRMPAARVFDTLEAARDWITAEASAVQLQIRWQSAQKGRGWPRAEPSRGQHESVVPCNGEGDRPDGTCWLCEPVITTRKQRARWRLAIAAVSVHKRNESPR